MNHLNIEIVHDIIALAQAHYPVEGNPQITPLADIIELAIENVPGENELYQKVASLSHEQLAELQALMVIGRGAGEETAADWERLYNNALASQHRESVNYITSKYPLARYLEKGLAKLGL
ncbi:DUF3775 domain-containing protein [Aeromonas piscicola]|uniref:DUF3775 domain-containing protein n=1 Tax=Aeromonas piscicola TaxID=600645 RepID=UPI0021F8B7DE|nr:DUF3775 domain-containing protein [Aeromonas piscicola]MCW0507544.1 DUF3775 domain-containing protein [Aeromonas piscicola]